MQGERAKKIEKAIRLTWSSLESHLPYTYQEDEGKKSFTFHKKCVREYAEVITLLSELY